MVLHRFVVLSRLWKCDKPRLCDGDGDDDLGDLESKAPSVIDQ